MGVLHSSGYVWWIERGKLAIGTTYDNGNTVSPPSTASHSIRVYGKEVGQIQRDGSVSTSFSTGTSIDKTEYSLLPSQFHEALIAKVMVKLYRKDPEGIAVSNFWDQVYKQHVIEAKKYANQGRLDTGFTVAQYDM